MASRAIQCITFGPGAKLTGTVDFVDDIDGGDSISSASVVAYWKHDGTDAAAVVFGTPSFATTVVTYGVQHIETGRTAFVNVLATMVSGQVLDHPIELVQL